MLVEVSSGSVAVLGGARVGVAGQDLRVAQGDAGVQRVGDRRVPQRVRADLPGDLRGLRNPGDNPVEVSPVDGPPETGLSTIGRDVRSPRHASRTRSTGTVSGMVAGLLPLPTRCSTRYPRRVSASSTIRTAAASEARNALMPSR